MKKIIISLLIIFVAQAVMIFCLASPHSEPVKWGMDEHGKYEITYCKYGNDVLSKIKQELSDYQEQQIENYCQDSNSQLVFVQRSSIHENRDNTTIVEYETIRKTYTSLDSGSLISTEVVEKAQFCIIKIDGNVLIDISPKSSIAELTVS